MISIALDKSEYMPGDTVRATISLKLKKAVKARGIYVRLVCRERKQVAEQRVMDKYDYDREKELGGFKETHIITQDVEHSRTLFRKENKPAGEGEFLEGEYETTFTLPSDAKPTSHEFGHDKAIHIWTLHVKLDIPLSFDANAEKEVIVGGLG
ncbi:MAG: hypothetical protein NTV88_02285 [Candidatus Micrarchaeota archaeon]|nr:hypothetical protein [Candidatus Micrarchaeota archaeon]